MDLTANLVDSVRSGDVVLVLGAGASIGASDSQGASPPTGPELARQISEKFLGNTLTPLCNTLTPLCRLFLNSQFQKPVCKRFKSSFEPFFKTSGPLRFI